MPFTDTCGLNRMRFRSARCGVAEMGQKQGSVVVALSLSLQLLDVRWFGSNQKVVCSLKSERRDGVAVCLQVLSKLLHSVRPNVRTWLSFQWAFQTHTLVLPECRWQGHTVARSISDLGPKWR